MAKKPPMGESNPDSDPLLDFDSTTEGDSDVLELPTGKKSVFEKGRDADSDPEIDLAGAEASVSEAKEQAEADLKEAEKLKLAFHH